jgi:hypothetical protein
MGEVGKNSWGSEKSHKRSDGEGLDTSQSDGQRRVSEVGGGPLSCIRKVRVVSGDQTRMPTGAQHASRTGLFDPGSVEQEKLQKPVVQRPVAPPPPFVPEISQTTRRQTWLDFLLG